jgi:hypothetical protein
LFCYNQPRKVRRNGKSGCLDFASCSWSSC